MEMGDLGMLERVLCPGRVTDNNLDATSGSGSGSSNVNGGGNSTATAAWTVSIVVMSCIGMALYCPSK